MTDDTPLERLEVDICSLAGRISAATCEFLRLIAAYDRRGGWGSWGCRSMAHWMAWKCGTTLNTARCQLRVAHALEHLPVIRSLFSDGRLSYSQVRALTKVATTKTDAQLANMARSMTATQLERALSSYRQAKAASSPDDEDEAARRKARLGLWSHEEEDGTRVIVIRQPPDEAHRLMTAIERETERQFQERRRAADSEPTGDYDSYALRRAQALSALAERGSHAAEDGDDPLIVLHVDPEVLTGDDPDGICHLEAGPAVEPETARRLSCGEATLTAAVNAGDLELRGSRTRRPTPALRRALARRDPTCVFPGCDARLGIHAHHVRHWAHGGPTTLDNLARLCAHHHHLVHEGGYTMRPASRPVNTRLSKRRRTTPRWVFIAPDGRPIPHTWPLQPATTPLGQEHVSDDACCPEWYGDGLAGFGLSVLIENLLTAEALSPDPPPPQPREEDTG